MTAWQCPQNLLRAENSTRWTPAKSVPRVGLGVKESEILYHWVNVSCTILWPLPQCVSYLNRHKALLCLETLLWSFLHRLIVIYIPVSTYCRLKKSPNIRTHRIYIISLFSILGANSRGGGCFHRPDDFQQFTNFHDFYFYYDSVRWYNWIILRVNKNNTSTFRYSLT